jgi:hypothetical protein
MGFESPETPWAHDDEGERGTSALSCSSHLLGKRGVRPKVVCDFKAIKYSWGEGRSRPATRAPRDCRTFWRWSDAAVDRAMLHGSLQRCSAGISRSTRTPTRALCEISRNPFPTTGSANFARGNHNAVPPDDIFGLLADFCFDCLEEPLRVLGVGE